MKINKEPITEMQDIYIDLEISEKLRKLIDDFTDAKFKETKEANPTLTDEEIKETLQPFFLAGLEWLKYREM